MYSAVRRRIKRILGKILKNVLVWPQCEHVEHVLVLRTSSEASFSNGMPDQQIFSSDVCLYVENEQRVSYAGRVVTPFPSTVNVAKANTDYKFKRIKKIEKMANIRIRAGNNAFDIFLPLLLNVRVLLNLRSGNPQFSTVSYKNIKTKFGNRTNLRNDQWRNQEAGPDGPGPSNKFLGPPIF